jgi:hypothetical protein
MSLEILWNYPAERTFYMLPMQAAETVDRAVITFAETGKGELDWDPPYHLLRAGSYDAVLSIDLKARTLTVLRIYRARP